jgi:LAGLIDADG-like domain
MTREQRAYLAGFFDGEGCVSARATREPYGIPLVSITMGQRKKATMMEIHKLIPYARWHESPPGRQLNGKSHKRFYRLFITKRGDGMEFIRAIYPFSIAKRDQLRVAYQILKLTGKSNLYKVDPASKEKRILLAAQLRDLKY